MKRYDPARAPAADEWLDVDEDERSLLVEAYHREARIRMPTSRRRVHASFHVIVEYQLAEDREPVVRAL